MRLKLIGKVKSEMSQICRNYQCTFKQLMDSRRNYKGD